MRPDDDDDALLAAYVDGVGELTPDERRRVEDRLGDPAARVDEVETRSMIARLRALPPEGQEPDWGQLERAIRDAVGTEVPRPWWRRWAWLAPLSTALTAALVLLIAWPRAVPRAPEHHDRHVPAPVAAPDAEDDAPVTLWLDGDAVDVDPVALDALAPPDTEDRDDDDGLLPASDLAWLDGLDDESIARAERWLDGKEKG
jgi:hypothetical protein